jgi:S-formylglutathione hydrolase FrmB
MQALVLESARHLNLRPIEIQRNQYEKSNPDSTYSGGRSSGYGVDYYDIKDVPHGDVLIKNYFSKTANAWRHIYVYTPPGYDNSLTIRYPVLYLQHGGGEDERVWIEMGRPNVILDNFLKTHQQQLVAAGITNSRLYISPATSHEWQTWRRSLHEFAPMLFQDK